jgi:hypothetical protein
MTYSEYDEGVADLGEQALALVAEMAKDLTLSELVALQRDARALDFDARQWAKRHPDGAMSRVIF